MKQVTGVFMLALLCLSAFQSCKSPAKYARQSWKNIETVPTDLDTSRHILLVAEMPRLRNPEQRNNSVTKKLDEAFKKYSMFRYEIVTVADIMNKSGKYSDTSVYKYAILNTLSFSQHGHTSTTSFSNGSQISVSPTATTTLIDFRFYDRVTGEQYRKSGKATSMLRYTVAAMFSTVQERQKVQASLAKK